MGANMIEPKVGTVVTRMLAGTIPMKLEVTQVDDNVIYCGKKGIGYKFDRLTGAEVDEELEWGPEFGVTGSFLKFDLTESPSANG
jgi:hypothetical protein